jgi:hypothetical protein
MQRRDPDVAADVYFDELRCPKATRRVTRAEIRLLAGVASAP